MRPHEPTPAYSDQVGQAFEEALKAVQAADEAGADLEKWRAHPDRVLYRARYIVTLDLATKAHAAVAHLATLADSLHCQPSEVDKAALIVAADFHRQLIGRLEFLGKQIDRDGDISLRLVKKEEFNAGFEKAKDYVAKNRTPKNILDR